MCGVSEAAYARDGKTHHAKVSGKAPPLVNVVVRPRQPCMYPSQRVRRSV
jgi:hypothetical protein